MGARGRKPKLPAVAELEGNPGKRRIDRSGEVKGEGVIFVPDHLADDAKACIEVIRSSMPPGTYAKVDSFALSAFASAWALHKEAVKQIADPEFEHIVSTAQGGQVANPWISILQKQAQTMAALGDRLGLDPKSRASLRLPSEAPRSKFAGMLGGQTESSDSSRH